MTNPRGPAWRVPFAAGYKCGFPGCDEVTAGRLWACRDHWHLLPVEIRDRLMAETNTPGENRGNKVRSDLFPIVEAEALAWIEANL